MTEDEKKDFIDDVKEELIEEEHLYLGIEFTDDSAEFLVDSLEKRVSQKVKYVNRHGDGYDTYNRDHYYCPACGRRLRNKQHDNCCGRCGQSLDWNLEGE